MQYLLLAYVQESGWEQLTKEQQTQGIAAYTAYIGALKEAGAFALSNRLQSSASATTVRLVDGKPQVLDGPFADSKEQIGGYFIIDAPDLDAALTWAARCPAAAHGTVEVRGISPAMAT
ncbi:MAG TPA: YciI family protein [Gemmatimonadaceae bacterium]|jgi:hypothetical protein